VNDELKSPASSTGIDPQRRKLILGGAAVAAIAAGGYGGRWFARWQRGKAPVFVAKHQKYNAALTRTIRDGLLAVGFNPATIKGRRVLLKPNLVEPSRDAPHMTTHPTMIVATADVFRAWGATVTVGEGPGHVRDTEMALVESGVSEALESVKLPFADLNYQETKFLPNQGNACKLAGFFFPQSVVEADLIVSLPKMKTHHWVGVTLSLKNMYGTIPGIRYGWPKNVLHHNGIPETVYDINASLPPTIAIVDGIDCMEGDGPIMGTMKPMGLVGIGLNPTALDATLARIMGMEPAKIPYLDLAADRLGPLDDALIDQRGERWQPLLSPFEILNKPHLLEMRSPGVLVS
jgi:uncharacterized protein (DUF362 family)